MAYNPINDFYDCLQKNHTTFILRAQIAHSSNEKNKGENSL